MSSNLPPLPSGRMAGSSNDEVHTLDLPSQAPPVLSQRSDVRTDSGFALWIHRISVLLFVSLSAIFGVLLVILPWTPKWTDNYIVISYPALRDFMENGFVRGMCSGLGLIDVWMGFSEATQYQEKQN